MKTANTAANSNHPAAHRPTPAELSLAERIFDIAQTELVATGLTKIHYMWDAASVNNHCGIVAIARALLPELTVWHFSPELPDDEIDVLFAAGDYVETGHHEGDHWKTIAGHRYDDSDVYAWAHLPAAPELPKGGAA